ncbi:alpha/beta hydrolase [Rhodobacteraceae bacterium SC52]|nr:alpha/beta hydrolase [Rhodobacteraceae bacterium SC52]
MDTQHTGADPTFLQTQSGRRIAYVRREGAGPGVVFLGGFASDMTGTKALHLEAWATAHGRAFLRFDYSGHGASSGAFADGCIGDWASDARAAIMSLTEGPQILVGSSMGGWISLLIARLIPEKIAGLVTIAAAPDFTESMWSEFSDAQQAKVREAGQVSLPSDYGAPLPITMKMIDEGRQNLVLNSPLRLPFPVRFLQGTADVEVSVDLARQLLDHAEGGNMRLTLVKGADHRFSTPECLALVEAAITEVTE